MKPREIKYVLDHSPLLRNLFRNHLDTLYPFLRQDVHVRLGDFQEGLTPCARCSRDTYPALKSPYNAWYPGWCIECVIDAHFTGAPRYDRRRDRSSLHYDSAYDQECSFLESFEDDGPEIALG